MSEDCFDASVSCAESVKNTGGDRVPVAGHGVASVVGVIQTLITYRPEITAHCLGFVEE